MQVVRSSLRDEVHDGLRGCSGTLGVSFGTLTILRGGRGANFSALGAILEPLGAHLGGSGGGSGGSWGALWGVRGRLGPFLAALRAIWAFFWAILEASWGLLGRSWDLSGASWAILDPLGTLLGREHALLPVYGPSGCALGAILGDLGTNFSKTNSKTKFGVPLGALLGREHVRVCVCVLCVCVCVCVVWGRAACTRTYTRAQNGDRSWSLLGRSWGDLESSKMANSGLGAAVLARRVAPPGYFLRKYSNSRYLKTLEY